VPNCDLHTDRLLLRRFRPDDVDDALAYRDDPELARYLPHIPQPFTRADAEAFVARNIDEPWDLLPTFAVVLENTVIGTVNLDIDPTHRTANLGFALARAHWGKGLATEAARAVVAWAFSSLDLAQLTAAADARNLRSRRVLTKLGMQLETILVSHERARDGVFDTARYLLPREAWQPR